MIEIIIGKIIGFLFSTVIAGVCYPLGKTGLFVRKGLRDGKKLKVALPIVGWVMFYFLLFLTLPLEIFLVSLILLIPVIMGFFGYVIVPKFNTD
jgi:hypothetical protein